MDLSIVIPIKDERDNIRKLHERLSAAVAIAREGHVPSRLRDVLREWSELRAEGGDHRGAYELTREALAVN